MLRRFVLLLALWVAATTFPDSSSAEALPPFPFPDCGPDRSENEIACAVLPSCAPLFTFAGQKLAGAGVFFVVDRSGSVVDVGELAIAEREMVRTLTGSDGLSQFAVLFFAQDLLVFPSSGRVPATFDVETVAEAVAFVEEAPGSAGSCALAGFLAAFELVGNSTAKRNVLVHAGDGGGTCVSAGMNESGLPRAHRRADNGGERPACPDRHVRHTNRNLPPSAPENPH
jgi:hypothetical protein